MSRYEKPGWKAFNIAVVAAVVGLVIWGAWKVLGWVGLLMCLPLCAWFLSRALVLGGFNLFEWLATVAYTGWNGRYNEFNHKHIRVYEHHDRLLFVADDVFTAAGITKAAGAHVAVHADELSEIPGSRHRGLGIRQVERLANEYPGTDAGRFLLWAQREVVGPWEKRRNL
jgi:hypothetical protein